MASAPDRNTLERVHKRGRVMRPASQRRLLQVHREKILCVELRGELFFGSSQQVLQQAREKGDWAGWRPGGGLYSCHAWGVIKRLRWCSPNVNDRTAFGVWENQLGFSLAIGCGRFRKRDAPIRPPGGQNTRLILAPLCASRRD